MLTKEQFCKYIKLIQDHQKEQRKVEDVIKGVLCKESVASVCDFGGELMEAIKELIAKAFDPTGELSESITYEIDYYLYGDTIDTPEMVYCKIQDIISASHFKEMVLDPCVERMYQKNNESDNV